DRLHPTSLPWPAALRETTHRGTSLPPLFYIDRATKKRVKAPPAWTRGLSMPWTNTPSARCVTMPRITAATFLDPRPAILGDFERQVETDDRGLSQRENPGKI